MERIDYLIKYLACLFEQKIIPTDNKDNMKVTLAFLKDLEEIKKLTKK